MAAFPPELKTTAGVASNDLLTLNVSVTTSAVAANVSVELSDDIDALFMVGTDVSTKNVGMVKVAALLAASVIVTVSP